MLKLGPFLSVGLVIVFFMPAAVITERDLYRDVIAIGAPPQTNASAIDSGQQLTHAWASQSYGTRLKPEDALLYFDGKLQERGWVVWYQEIGSKHYCKGKNEAVVSYSSGGKFELYLRQDGYRDCGVPDDYHIPLSINFLLHSSSFPWIFYGVLGGFAFWRMGNGEYLRIFPDVRFGPLQAFLGGMAGLALAIFLAFL
jgi:hypothetical protein